MKTHKIVITGGPCAGKTTVIDALRAAFADDVLLMPEVPTLLLANGYPRPGIEVPFSDEWLHSFQNSVFTVQNGMEQEYVAMARDKKTPLLVFDRGILDPAAYTPGGELAYLRSYNIDKDEAYKRYDSVIHLEAVAVCQPELFAQLKETNAARYESAEIAIERDQRLREVWQDHPDWQVIPGKLGIDHVVETALTVVRRYLDN